MPPEAKPPTIKDVGPDEIYAMLKEIRDAIKLPDLGRERASYVRSHIQQLEILAGSALVKFPQPVTYLLFSNPDRALTVKLNDGSAVLGQVPALKTTVLRIPTSREVTITWAAAAGVTQLDFTASSLPLSVTIQS